MKFTAGVEACGAVVDCWAGPLPGMPTQPARAATAAASTPIRPRPRQRPRRMGLVTVPASGRGVAGLATGRDLAGLGGRVRFSGTESGDLRLVRAEGQR